MNAEERQRVITERKQPIKDRKERLWCIDEWREFAVYRVPVEALLLNVENRRFTAERTLMEEELGRALDPENNPNDELSVISILLDKAIHVDGDRVVGTPRNDSEALKQDWETRKQESPFWIRPDGVVRNGNRRLAVVKRLRGEKGVEGGQWVDAVILDRAEIDEGALFDMEQREQLTENLKVRYTDINLLLTLKDAANARRIDWADPDSIDQIAGELQHVAGGNQAYASIQLRAIKYMDAFLADSRALGQYHKVLRQVERFRDVGKIMVKMERDYPDEAADILRLAFAAIRASNPHEDIRALRKIFIEDRARYNRLLKSVEKEEEEWEKATDREIAEPDTTAATDVEGDAGETDGDTEPPGPVVPNYPEEKVRERIKNAIDGFQAQQLSLVVRLEQAFSRLEELNKDRLTAALAGENAEAVRTSLENIIAWAEAAKGILKGKKK